MAFDLLNNISPASKHWNIRVRVARMWDYCGTTDQQPPIHVDLVLVDEKGNAMYAEIPGDDADKYRPILKEGDVYTLSKFFVVPSKRAYKPFASKYMIKITPWTNVIEVADVPLDFPTHVFNLVPFSDLSLRVGMQEYFTDVIGMVVGVSKLAYIRMASNTSDTPKRVLALKDLSNCEVKLVLWGQRALDFDADSIHDIGQDNAVVGIFVGTLMKAYNNEETLSGGSACRWYLNEDMPEINAFFDSLSDNASKIKWISTGVESFGSVRRSTRSEHKTVAELKKVDPWEADGCNFTCTVTIARLAPSQPWWFFSRSRCHKSALPYGDSYKCSGGCSAVAATPKFRLCLIGTDGTDSAEFVLFGRIAQQVVGRPVMSLMRFQGKSDNLPREIAAVVAQKFTFSVSFTDKNLMQRTVSFQVDGIQTFFGRQGSIPQIKEQAPPMDSSGGTFVVVNLSTAKDAALLDSESEPVALSTTPVALIDEVPSGSKKRRSITRRPLGVAKKLSFDTPGPEQKDKFPATGSVNASVDDATFLAENESMVLDHLNVSASSTMSVLAATKGSDGTYSEDKKKGDTMDSASVPKSKPASKKGK